MEVKEEPSDSWPAGKLELNYFQCFLYCRESCKIPESHAVHLRVISLVFCLASYHVDASFS